MNPTAGAFNPVSPNMSPTAGMNAHERFLNVAAQIEKSLRLEINLIFPSLRAAEETIWTELECSDYVWPELPKYGGSVTEAQLEAVCVTAKEMVAQGSIIIIGQADIEILFRKRGEHMSIAQTINAAFKKQKQTEVIREEQVRMLIDTIRGHEKQLAAQGLRALPAAAKMVTVADEVEVADLDARRFTLPYDIKSEGDEGSKSVPLQSNQERQLNQDHHSTLDRQPNKDHQSNMGLASNGDHQPAPQTKPGPWLGPALHHILASDYHPYDTDPLDPTRKLLQYKVIWKEKSNAGWVPYWEVAGSPGKVAGFHRQHANAVGPHPSYKLFNENNWHQWHNYLWVHLKVAHDVMMKGTTR